MLCSFLFSILWKITSYVKQMDCSSLLVVRSDSSVKLNRSDRELADSSKHNFGQHLAFFIFRSCPVPERNAT